MPTPIFCCGAECGINVAGASGGVLHWNTVTLVGTGNTWTADTGTHRSPGARAFKSNCAAAAGQAFATKNLSSPATVVGRLYVNFSALPSATHGLLRITVNSGSHCEIRYLSTGTTFEAGVQANRQAWSGTISTGTWYRLDFRCTANGTTTTIEWSVDGVGQTNSSLAQAATSFTAARFGLGSDLVSVQTGVMFIDDLLLSSTSGDYPLGAGQIVGLSPNQDGTSVFNLAGDFKYNNSTNVAVGATDTWNSVNVVPLTQTTTFLAVVGASNTEYLEWQFAHTGSDVGTVNGVEVVSSHYAASTTANKQTMRLNDGGTTNDVFTDTDFSQTTLCYNSKQYATKPTGGAWTKSTVDAVRARWNSSFGTVDESPVPFIAGVMLEVDYIPSSTNPTDTDTETVTEAATIVLPVRVTETGTLTDPVPVIVLPTIASDAIALAESAVASQGAGQLTANSSDTGTLSESASAVLPTVAADSGALTEAASAVLPTISADSGAMTEVASSSLPTVSADSGTATDALSALKAVVSVVDALAVSEGAVASQGTTNRVVTDTDSAAIVEALLASLPTTSSDTGTVADRPSGLTDQDIDAILLSEQAFAFMGSQLNSMALAGGVTFTARTGAQDILAASAAGIEGLD